MNSIDTPIIVSASVLDVSLCGIFYLSRVFIMYTWFFFFWEGGGGQNEDIPLLFCIHLTPWTIITFCLFFNMYKFIRQIFIDKWKRFDWISVTGVSCNRITLHFITAFPHWKTTNSSYYILTINWPVITSWWFTEHSVVRTWNPCYCFMSSRQQSVLERYM